MTDPKNREHNRHKITDTFVVNREGVCQVFDLSSGGFSFGCINERELPEKWTVDIINDKGVRLWDLPVETVWAKKYNTSPKTSIHTIKVGARFLEQDMSPVNKSALQDLLEFLNNNKS